MCESDLVKLSPASMVPDPHLCPIAEEALTARRVVPHDGRVVERSEPLHVAVIRRGSIGQQYLVVRAKQLPLSIIATHNITV